jgi:ketosteroid isomerase-like protein
MAASLPLDQQLYARFLENDPQAEMKTQERNNVLLLQSLFAALARGDLQVLVASFANDIDWEILGSPNLPFVRACRGREAAGRALHRNLESWHFGQIEIRDVIAQGNQVVVVGHDRGRFQPNGPAAEVHYMQVFTMLNGQIAKFREIADITALPPDV